MQTRMSKPTIIPMASSDPLVDWLDGLLVIIVVVVLVVDVLWVTLLLVSSTSVVSFIRNGPVQPPIGVRWGLTEIILTIAL